MLKLTKPFAKKTPIVYLVGTPIGNLNDVSARAIEILKSADIIACEDTRNTSFLLNSLGVENKKIVSCYSQKEQEESVKLIKEVSENNLILAFVSDAGNPGISDPGSLLVKEAIDNDIPVSAVLGPSAFIQALILSGFDTSDFSFYGFPPVKENARVSFFKELINRPETLVFYESPHRLLKTLASMKKAFGGERRMTLSRELTKIHEEYIRGTIDECLEIPSEKVRGEFVIVVEGNDKEVVISDEVILQLLRQHISQGKSVKEAISLTCDELSIGKNQVYKIAKDNL